MSVINRNSGKIIHLCLGNEGLRLFLTALLCEWSYTVDISCPMSPDELLVTDGNCTRCAEHRKRINLTTSAYIDSDHVNLPIVVEKLWQVLEKHYHSPPRHHLRLVVDYPITMEIRGQQQAGELSSLSPAGARLTLPRELAIGELIPIVLPLQRNTLRLLGKVIYVTTFPDSKNCYDAGVLFERITAEERSLLRETIVMTLFTSIRPLLPRWAFEVGISHFDLSPVLRNQL